MASMGSLLGGAAPMLCGSGVLPLHMAAGQGTPLKLAAATCGRLLRSVSCSGGATASRGRQSGSPSSALSWQPAQWRSIISRAGTAGLLTYLACRALAAGSGGVLVIDQPMQVFAGLHAATG